MTTTKQIEIAEALIATDLVKAVFHSVQLLKDHNGTLYPAFPKGGEYTYTGIDDTKGLFAYIRTNGDTVAIPMKLQSCGRTSQLTIPLRIVFFNDNEDRDHEYLTTKLVAFTFLQHITLSRIITDKYRLRTEESPMFREKFDGKTFYIAVDIFISLILKPSDCETDDCIVHPNPLKCPVAAQGSTSSAT